VVLGPGAAAVRRDVGAMAWAVFEELAGRAERSVDGWSCAASIRDLAQGVGVNKDTAGGALVALESAGLVRREVVAGVSSSVPARYRLVVPVGVELSCPDEGDTARRPGNGDTARRPGNGDTARRPGNGDTARRPGNGDTDPGRVSSQFCPGSSDTGATRRGTEAGAPAAASDHSAAPGVLDPAGASGPHRTPRPTACLAETGGQGSLFDPPARPGAGHEPLRVRDHREGHW
jgi:hypothetical protein